MQDEVNFHWLYDMTLALQDHKINILILKTIYSWCIDIASVSARILTKMGEWGAFWPCIDQHICSLPEKYSCPLHSLFQGLVGSKQEVWMMLETSEKYKRGMMETSAECFLLSLIINSNISKKSSWVTGNKPQEVLRLRSHFCSWVSYIPFPSPSPPTQLHVTVSPTCTLSQWGRVQLATCTLSLIPISKTS